MGTVPKTSSLYLDGNAQKDKEKNKRYQRAKLRKSGFDTNELGPQHALIMHQRYWDMAESQLSNVQVNRYGEIPALPYLESFEEIQLNDKVHRALEIFKIHKPTPAQQVVIPYVLHSTADLMIQAQTGSGKTLAFLLPIIRYITERKGQISDWSPNRDSPYAVIVVPTRELAFQLTKDAKRLTRDLTQVRVAFGIGDVDMRESAESLKQGCDILVVTPGRLHHYFFNNEREEHQSTLVNTKNIRFVVLDEADKLIEGERRKSVGETKSDLPHMRQIIKTFVDSLTAKKQDFRLLLFSATLRNDFLYELVVPNNLVEFRIGAEHMLSSVQQNFLKVERDFGKQEIFMALIEELSHLYYAENPDAPHYSDESNHRSIGRTIIFVNSKRLADRLTYILRSAKFLATTVSSDLTGKQRYESMEQMIEGKVDILVATDCVARGLNITRLEHVINYDLPQRLSFREYIHRIGRCGRVGHLGAAYNFFNVSEDYRIAEDLIRCCEAVGQSLPDYILNCAPPMTNKYAYQHRFKSSTDTATSGDSGNSSAGETLPAPIFPNSSRPLNSAYFL